MKKLLLLFCVLSLLAACGRDEDSSSDQVNVQGLQEEQVLQFAHDLSQELKPVYSSLTAAILAYEEKQPVSVLGLKKFVDSVVKDLEESPALFKGVVSRSSVGCVQVEDSSSVVFLDTLMFTDHYLGANADHSILFKDKSGNPIFKYRFRTRSGNIEYSKNEMNEQSFPVRRGDDNYVLFGGLSIVGAESCEAKTNSGYYELPEHFVFFYRVMSGNKLGTFLKYSAILGNFKDFSQELKKASLNEADRKIQAIDYVRLQYLKTLIQEGFPAVLD